MNKIIIILFIALGFLTGCGNDISSNDITQNPESPRVGWENPALWGNPIQSIDHSGKVLFVNDSRIANLHKHEYSQFGDKYVLWRMTHDGSCWVSSALTLMLFNMIEGGQAKFHAAAKKMRAIASNNSSKDLDADLQDFLNIIDFLGTKMDHRFSLDFRNHQTIYDKLDTGMRRMLAQFVRNGGPAMSSAQSIETYKSWGYADDFCGLFRELSLDCPVIDINAFGEGTSFPNFDTKKMPYPRMMIIHSSSAFIDVLVDKRFSDRVNKT